MSEEWERENSQLKEELENSKIQVQEATMSTTIKVEQQEGRFRSYFNLYHSLTSSKSYFDNNNTCHHYQHYHAAVQAA